MIKRILTTGLVLSTLLGPALAAAKEFNNNRPFLPPFGQVKINNARAQLFVFQKEAEESGQQGGEQGAGASCPDGVFVDRSNPRREVIIATQDIVNLGGELDLSAACR
jgi:hypothetical protein